MRVFARLFARVSRTVLPAISVCLLLSISTGTASADEVRMVDGRVLEGEVVSKPESDVVDLKVSSGGMSVTQHLPRHQIVSVTYGVSARQKEAAAIATARADLGSDLEKKGDAAAWYALVERARAIGDNILGRDLAEEVVLRDRQHAQARSLLGQNRYRGVWMKTSEQRLAEGLVVHQGRAVTWDEREGLLAKAEATRQAAEDRRTQREEDRQRRAIQAASVAALASTPDPYQNIRYPAQRAIYWPPVCTPVLPPQAISSGIRISAGGGSSSFHWNLNWNTGLLP